MSYVDKAFLFLVYSFYLVSIYFSARTIWMAGPGANADLFKWMPTTKKFVTEEIIVPRPTGCPRRWSLLWVLLAGIVFPIWVLIGISIGYIPCTASIVPNAMIHLLLAGAPAVNLSFCLNWLKVPRDQRRIWMKTN